METNERSMDKNIRKSVSGIRNNQGATRPQMERRASNTRKKRWFDSIRSHDVQRYVSLKDLMNKY